MSGSMIADRGYPALTPTMSDSQKIKALDAYIVELVDLLRHDMRNLGVDNFNSIGLKEVGKTINSDVYVYIDDKNKGLSNQITVSAEGLTEKISAVDGRVTEVKKTADGVSSVVSDPETGLAAVSITAGKINWLVADGDNASNFTMTSRAISQVADNIDLTGFVKLTSLENPQSKSFIDGGNIKTDNLYVTKIKGKDVELYDTSEKLAGHIYISPADTAKNALDISATSARLKATTGNVFISAPGMSVQLNNTTGNMEVPRCVQIDGAALALTPNMSWGTLFDRPPDGIYGQVYFVTN